MFVFFFFNNNVEFYLVKSFYSFPEEKETVDIMLAHGAVNLPSFPNLSYCAPSLGPKTRLFQAQALKKELCYCFFSLERVI